MADPFSFTGKVAIVTGSTRGIGAAAARQIAERGGTVVVSSRKAEACEAARDALVADGFKAIAIPAHVGRAEDCARLVAETVAQLGRLDVIVANAAVNPVFSRLDELDEAVWDKVIETNLTAPFRLAKHALPVIAEGGGGAMVILSSISSGAAAPMSAAYGISKAGVERLARQLAVEWGERNVRVNAVSPGTTRTDMIRSHLTKPGYEERLLARTPLGRIGDPEDVAAAVTFLASNAARHITGQVLTVDGGETIMRGR